MAKDNGGGDAQTVEHDDGFTDEERAQFEAMRDTGAPAGGEPGDGGADGGAASADGELDPAIAAAAAAGGAADDDSDDADDEPAAGAGAGTPGAEKTPRRVNFNKFKRVQDELEAERAKNVRSENSQARLDERLRIINEALTTPTPPAKAAVVDDDPEPDKETDLLGHYEWQIRKNAQRTQKLEADIADMQTGRQTETADRQLETTYLSDAQQFAAKEPNFVPAYTFLMNTRTAEMALTYFGKELVYDHNGQLAPASADDVLSPQETAQIMRAVAVEEKQIVASAYGKKQSGAQMIYKFARARGFKPNAPVPAAGAAAAKPGAPAAGAAAAAAPAARAAAVVPAAAAAAQPSVLDEINRLKAGQDAAMSLSNGGGAPENPLTPERLLAMGEEEFGELLDSISPSQRAKLFGNA